MHTVKPVLSGHLKKRTKVGFQDHLLLMQVKIIAECSKHSAIFSTLFKLPFVVKTFVLSILSGHFRKVLLYTL